ncbi:MAG: CocE/NonD family hydrolase [Candidatus Coproplasma sp.]
MNTKKFITLYDKQGKEMKVPVRDALSVSDPKVRYTGFRQETLILKKGSIRMKGAKPLECDMVFERDVPIKLRDGTTIYTDIFRPVGEEKCPALVALSPYGKEIGTQWLDDVPMRAGVPKKAASGLQKFEGPDPVYWVKHGYAVINPDVRGAYNSEGVVLFFGSDYGRDGKDIVDWVGEQPWCNGKIGLSGNSWLAISQWFTAAQQPKHLAAIAPWEGLYDCYREVGTRGGVIMPEFVELLSASFASNEQGGVEDVLQMLKTHPEMNNYWEDKIADLEDITVPAYIAASYTNPIHTNGSIEGFMRISSKDKWLRIHNAGEWDDYYHEGHTEDLRKFFDYYLKGIENGWKDTPKVRMSVLNPGGKDIIDRVESEYPLARTQYQKLYLNASNNSLERVLPKEQAQTIYNSDENGKAVYRMRMTENTEIGGFIKLRIWAQAPDNDDMDLQVTLEKLNRFGRKIGLMPMKRVQAKGYIRASMRELDDKRSTEQYPYQTFAKEQKLQKGEIVPLDIAIWPMGMLFKKGEILQITISAYKTKQWASPFNLKMATIKVAKDGYTYMPKDKPKMITLGGVSGGLTGGIDCTGLPKDHNKGRHIIYTGGKHDSFLYLPVIPKK